MMKSARLAGAWLILVLLLTTSCGGGSGQDVSAEGTANAGSDACTESSTSIYDYFDALTTWIATDVLVIGDPEDPSMTPELAEIAAQFYAERPALVTPREPEQLSGSPVDQFLVRASVAEDVERAQESATFLAGLYETGVAEVVAVQPDENVRFLGLCGEQLDQALDRVEEQLADGGRPPRSEAALVREIISEPDGAAMQLILDGETPPSQEELVDLWNESGPDNRQIHAGETPPEVLESLQELQLTLDVPDEWTSFPYQVCPKNSIGWTDCTSAETVQAPFPTYAVVGEPLELWLVGSDFAFTPEGVQGERHLIATVPSEHLGTGAVTVKFTTVDLADLLEGKADAQAQPSS